MKPTTPSERVEKRGRTKLFIAGIVVLGFLPIVFATFFLLFEGVAADLVWVLGVLSVVDGAVLLLWYTFEERKARRRIVQPEVSAKTP